MSVTRRKAIAVLAAAIVAPCAAQPGQDRRRIGFLSGNRAPPPSPAPSALAKLLKAEGFEEGRNLIIERRYFEGSVPRANNFAEELVQKRVDVVLAAGNEAVLAAMRATMSIPIVMAWGIAPIEAGFVKSLARPEANVTGNAFHTPETGAKIFDMLREAFPKAKSVVQLWNPSRPGYGAYEKALRSVAATRGLRFESVGVSDAEEAARTMQRIEALNPDLLLVMHDISLEKASEDIARFAARRKLPSIGTIPNWVEWGGLLYYGPDEEDNYRRAASYVARLLRGAKPADLPIEQPTLYRFMINAKTAREMGYAIPPWLRLRADHVIE